MTVGFDPLSDETDHFKLPPQWRDSFGQCSTGEELIKIRDQCNAREQERARGTKQLSQPTLHSSGVHKNAYPGEVFWRAVLICSQQGINESFWKI
jgi:hypothetical protein